VNLVQACIRNLDDVTIHRHDAAHLDKICGYFEKEKEAMLYHVSAVFIKVLLAMLTKENSERGI
jgi:hypothetical protein